MGLEEGLDKELLWTIMNTNYSLWIIYIIMILDKNLTHRWKHHFTDECHNSTLGGIKMSEKQMSRKSFLKGMGTTLAGATVLGGMSGVLTGESSAAPENQGEVSYPLQYTKVDPDKVADRAYAGYKEKGG